LAFRRWFHARGRATLVVMQLGPGQQPEFWCVDSIQDLYFSWLLERCLTGDITLAVVALL